MESFGMHNPPVGNWKQKSWSTQWMNYTYNFHKRTRARYEFYATT